MRTTDWIQTASGCPFWPLEPRHEDVHIEDIAHALSHLCRFGGHVRMFYSVAQHCVLASFAIEPEDPRDPLFALLHDASEAYLLDIPRPVKRSATLVGYRVAEADLQRVIYEACGLDPLAEPSAVLKALDRRLLRTEQRDLMPPPALDERRDDAEPLRARIVPWTPHKARWAFLDRYVALRQTLGMCA